jgi:hypothetical protein
MSLKTRKAETRERPMSASAGELAVIIMITAWREKIIRVPIKNDKTNPTFLITT